LNNSTAFSTTRFLLLWAGTFLYLSAHAQGGFSRLYPEGSGTGNILYDHPYIITAAQTSDSNAQRGIIFYRFNLNGDTLFTRTHFETSRDIHPGFQNSLIKSTDGSYILTGYRLPESYILKLDTNFNIQDSVFFKAYGEWTGALSMTEASNGDFLVTGSTYQPDSVTQQPRKGFLAARFDADLNPKWIKRFHTPSVNGKVVEQQAHNVMEDSKGNIWLGGYRQEVGADNVADVLVMVLDSNGGKVMEKAYGDPNLDEGIATILEAPDSNYIVVSNLGIEVGHFAGETGAKTKIRISKIDSDGSIIWDKVYGPKRLTNYASNAEILSTNEIVISGYYIDSEVDYTLRDALFRSYSFKTNFNGDSIWYREYIAGYHYNDWNRLFDISATPEGGFVAGGHFLSSNNSPLTGGAGSHVWIIKADSLGCVVPRCQYVSLPEPEPKTSINLYPNPTHGSFYLQGLQGKTLSLRVYDASGQEVLYQESISEGEAIQLNEQPSGLYMLQLLERGEVLFRKKIVKH